ncbi:MAG: response regulator [Pseudomonadota bacterium]
MRESGSILIVDDNPNNLQVLGGILELAGYKVRPALSGEIALRAIDAAAPDLILLDIRMTGINGYETCQRLKADPRTQDIPVIFISAMHDIEDKLRAFQSGGVDYLAKPFHTEEVLARVVTHLRIRSLQKRLEHQNEHLQELVDAKAAELSKAYLESSKRLAEIAHMNRNLTSSVYSAAIAHDLRQPLAAILSNAEAAELFLERDPPALDEVKEILADIRRDDHRASKIIQRMRNLLNKGETTIETLNLNEVVQDVLHFLSGEAQLRHITMVAEVSPAALTVLADRIQLEQVVVNLLLNSMEAMSEKTDAKQNERQAAHGTISIVTRCINSSHGEVTVTDNGSGFKDNAAHVFESFFTTKAHGMGMGLSITASLIQLHNGQISAENGANGGAIVRFSLPLQSTLLL